MLRRLRKGQSTMEYAVVIGLVIAAAVGMQIYVKRGLQAKIKGAVDYNDSTAGSYGVGTGQYEPNYQTETAMRTTRNATERATTTTGGALSRVIVGNEVSNKTGTSTILAP